MFCIGAHSISPAVACFRVSALSAPEHGYLVTQLLCLKTRVSPDASILAEVIDVSVISALLMCTRIRWRHACAPQADETRTFATTTTGALIELQEWLSAYFELALADAQHIRNVPGRKTDVSDAAWIAELLELCATGADPGTASSERIRNSWCANLSAFLADHTRFWKMPT